MILVDTSVWVDHLRAGDAALGERLNRSQVLIHPFVLGELACCNLHNRGEELQLLKALPQAIVARDEEALSFIERNALMGVDVQNSKKPGTCPGSVLVSG